MCTKFMAKFFPLKKIKYLHNNFSTFLRGSKHNKLNKLFLFKVITCFAGDKAIDELVSIINKVCHQNRASTIAFGKNNPVHKKRLDHNLRCRSGNRFS